MIVFERKELAESSLTGKVSNLHKNKDLPPKKQLCPNRVNGMLGNSCIQTLFHPA